MAINDKDFSGFDELSIDEKLNMLYRLLTHVETELDRMKDQLTRIELAKKGI